MTTAHEPKFTPLGEMLGECIASGDVEFALVADISDKLEEAVPDFDRAEFMDVVVATLTAREDYQAEMEDDDDAFDEALNA